MKHLSTKKNTQPEEEDAVPESGYTSRMKAVMEQTSRHPTISEMTARQKAVEERTARRKAAEAAREAERMRKRKTVRYIVSFSVAVLAILALAIALKNVNNQREYNKYYDAGMEYYNASDYENALVYLRKAANSEQTNEVMLLITECYIKQGNYDKALEVLRKLDTSNSEIAGLILSVEGLRTSQTAGETVTIGNREYPVGTTSLVLDGLNLGDSGLQQATQLFGLVNLSATNSGISSVSSLTSLGGLTTLNLSDNNISDISPLAQLTNLRTLYLDNNPVQDLTPLYTLTNLTTLSIKGINISESQLTALSSALPNCAIHSEQAEQVTGEITIAGITFSSDVAELNLSGMGISDISALANCTSLTRLDLSNNYISDLTPLMQIPSLRWLDFSGNNVSDARPLMGITSLNYVDASGNNISTTVPFEALTSLSELYLDNNPISNFSGLKKLKSLETLSLKNTGIQDEGLNYLARLTNLRMLYLEDNPDLTGEVVDALGAAIPECMISHSDLVYSVTVGQTTVRTDTTELYLGGQGITDISGLMSCTELQSVNLSNNYISNVSALSFCTELVSLDISNNNISDMSPLLSLTNLVTLNLSYNQISSVSALCQMTWLRELHVEGNMLTDDDVQLLMNSLPNCAVYANNQTPLDMSQDQDIME